MRAGWLDCIYANHNLTETGSYLEVNAFIRVSFVYLFWKWRICQILKFKEGRKRER